MAKTDEFKALEAENAKHKNTIEAYRLLLSCVLRIFEKYVLSEDKGELLDDFKLIKQALKKEKG